MDAFSYLSVLLSIIIGLAMTQVLQGYRAMLLNRRRVTLFFPSIAWSAFLLLIAVQMWWSSFGLADRTEWSFLTFFIILLQTILLYMLAGLVLPDVPPAEQIDLKAHYFRELVPFYGLLLATVAISVIKNLMLDGGLERGEAVFHFAFAGLAVVAMLVRRPILHHVIATGIGAALVTYISLLFARL